MMEKQVKLIPRDTIAGKMLIKTALEQELVRMELMIQNAWINEADAGTWRITVERVKK